MPQAVGGFIGWIVGAAFEGLVAIGLSEAAAIFVVDAGIKLAGLAVLGNLAEKLVDIPDVAQTATENLVTTRGTIEHQRMIYGEVLVSGPLWYMNRLDHITKRCITLSLLPVTKLKISPICGWTITSFLMRQSIGPVTDRLIRIGREGIPHTPRQLISTKNSARPDRPRRAIFWRRLQK
jgi:hypothetical protein